MGLVGVLVMALAAVAGSTAAATDPSPGPGKPQPHKIDPKILDEFERVADRPGRGGERVEALVVMRARPDLSAERGKSRAVRKALQSTARASQDSVVDQIRERDDRVLNKFWLKNTLLVRAKPQTLRALTASDAVSAIIPNSRVSVPPLPDPPSDAEDETGPSTWGIEKIGADVVHNELGITGEDVRVAVLDTGVDVDHPDLRGKLATADPSDPAYPGGWMEFSATGQPVESSPHDSNYHGTHVAGTVAGGNESGTQIGVAPGVDLMAGLILPGGNGTFAQVLAGMQWAVAPHDAAGNPVGEPADVVNMSLGVTGKLAALVEPTRNMHAAGVFPSFSIGNNCGGGSESPGNVWEATGVGATDESDGVGDFSCGEVVHKSDWSNPPAHWPETYVVPDVSAPGVDVYSAFPQGEYGVLDGTSMAAPHVSGTVALMLQGGSSLSVDELLQTVIDTSTFDDRYGSDRPNPRYGWGRIDAHRAVSEVALDEGIAGRIVDAKSGEPVAGATVTRLAVDRDVETGPDGRYRMPAPSGTHDIEISRFGYETVTVEGVEVGDGGFTTVDRQLTPLPSGRVAGTVTYGPTGSSVPGARVRVLDVDTDRSAETSFNGRYTLDGLPDGSYRVVASAPGFPRSEAAHVDVTSGRTTRRVDLALPRPWSTQRISVGPDGTEVDGDSLVPALSTDGRYVAYYSFASGVVDDDTNGQGDVFVHDRGTGETERVSVGAGGTEGDRASVRPALSGDGRYVAYSSFATNLVEGDTNSTGDIFVHDRETGETERVSVGAGGTEANGGSFAPAISADGRFVSYYSFASDLVEDDSNDQGDVFVHDRETGETERVSVGSDGAQGNAGSFVSSLSADGNLVAFESLASTLVDGDTNGRGDVFVRDRDSGTTRRVSVADDGSEGGDTSQGPSLSADGRHVAFYSGAELVDDDTNELDDVYVRDLQSGATRLVSTAADGAPGNGSSQGIPKVSLSADGRFVSYYSSASNLVAGDTNGRVDVFVHDRTSNVTRRASLAPDGSQGDRPSQGASISADGRTLAFHSAAATLAAHDTNRETDVFVFDMEDHEPRARFALAHLRIEPSPARPGRPVLVMARVKNIGALAGTYDAVLRIDGEEVERAAVRLVADDWSWARFTVRRHEAGDYEVTVGPLAGRLLVE